MIELTKIIFSLIPVIFFLIVLIIWDSYKIVKFSSVILTIFYGCLVALFCLILNKWILHQFQIKITVFTQYLAPFIEELFKSILIFGFIRLKRIGFLVDGAILGFGVGAGFALTENLYYLHQLQSPNLLMWIVRGFGTAIMHGGTTAIFALVAQTISDRFPTSKIIIFIPAFLFAYALHSFFNHFFL